MWKKQVMMSGVCKTIQLYIKLYYQLGKDTLSFKLFLSLHKTIIVYYIYWIYYSQCLNDCLWGWIVNVNANLIRLSVVPRIVFKKAVMKRSMSWKRSQSTDLPTYTINRSPCTFKMMKTNSHFTLLKPAVTIRKNQCEFY